MGNKEMENKRKKNVWLPPHCRELKKRKERILFILFSSSCLPKLERKTKKKSAHPLVHPWPKILRRKEEERLKRFGHACN